jgi:hypothetical protein
MFPNSRISRIRYQVEDQRTTLPMTSGLAFLRREEISGAPTGLYEEPTGVIGSARFGASLWNEYFAPDASLTFFIMRAGETSD